MAKVILDVDNLCHRNWYAMNGTQMVTKDVPNDKRCIFGVLRDILKISEYLDSKNFLFCFDEGRSSRVATFPAYKANHVHDNIWEEIQRQKWLLHNTILPAIGFRNLYSKEGYEADDLMAFLCIGLSELTYLVSNDQDLYQLIDDTVHVWNPHTKSELDAYWFEKKHKIKPAQWTQFKALAGCKSDNIPGVVGDVTAMRFIRGTLSTASKYYDRIMAGESVYRRNLELVTLPYVSLADPGLEIVSHEVTNKNWREVVSHWKLPPSLERCSWGL